MITVTKKIKIFSNGENVKLESVVDGFIKRKIEKFYFYYAKERKIKKRKLIMRLTIRG